MATRVTTSMITSGAFPGVAAADGRRQANEDFEMIDYEDEGRDPTGYAAHSGGGAGALELGRGGRTGHVPAPPIQRAQSERERREKVDEKYVDYLRIPRSLATNEPITHIFRAGSWWEQTLCAIVFLAGGLYLVIALTNPFIGWLNTGKKFIKKGIEEEGAGWYALLIIHIVFSCLMLLCIPVLVIPYFLRRQRWWFDLCYWIYVVTAVPGIGVCIPLSFISTPRDFATITAYFIGTLFWFASLPLVVWYRVFRPNQRQLYIWLLRQFAFTWSFPVLKNFIVQVILFKGTSLTKEEMYGASIWMVNFLVVVLGEWLLIPWFVNKYTAETSEEDDPLEDSRPFRQQEQQETAAKQWPTQQPAGNFRAERF